MAKSNGAAVGIHARVIIRDAKLAQAGNALRGEGLVQLELLAGDVSTLIEEGKYKNFYMQSNYT